MKYFTNNFLFLAAALFLTSQAFGQAIRLTGVLTDSDNSPVEIANVLLLNEGGDLVTGDFVYDGSYSIEAPGAGTYVLHFTAIGFADGSTPLDLPEGVDSYDVPTFGLEAAGVDIATVEVTALRKPLFENQAGKLIVNVGESQLAAGSSVQELLAKTPTVQAEEEGGVSVFGKGQAIVLLDGRRVTGNELTSLPADDIEKIEVISNPSARYEASGRAVINITSKKNRRQGTYFNLTSSQRFGRHWRSSNGVLASFRNSKVNLQGSYYYHPYKKDFTEEYEREQGEVALDQRIDRLRDQHRAHTYRASLDYNLGPESGIGLQYRGAARGQRDQVSNVNLISGAGDLTGIFNASNSGESSMRNSLTFNYWKNFGDDGKELRFIADVVDHNFDKSELFNESFRYTGSEDESRQRQSTNRSDVTVGTAQLDFTLPTTWGAGSLTTGVRAVSIESRSSLLFEEMIGSVMIEDDNLSNKYNYQENVGAGFTDWAGSFGKLKAQAGLRAEYTQTDGVSRGGNGTVIDRDYLNIFPSIGFTYPVAHQLDMNLKYGKRIDRPSFGDLDPFLFYIDSLSYSQGNPDLLPALSHNIDYSLIYRQFASFNVGYQETNNALFQYVEPIPDQEGGARLSMRNLDRVRTFSVGLTLPYQTKTWTTVNNFGMKWNEVSTTLNGEELEFNRPLWYAAFYNSVKIGKGLTVEATIQYNSSGQNGIFTFSPNLQTNAAISKKMLGDKLSLTLSANDFFNIDRNRTQVNIEGLDVSTESFYDAHWVQFAVKYRVGTNKSSKLDRSIGNENSNRIN
ncbi:outer membrane beta-barrel protein [Neolewinella aurantiaca]|uniref:Outer membrane beta-barrel protein n=1 Tax=Neolewinella aurantiaca TaxID=2602767 RepID=A0A5C7FM35_9BACT|nr:TonB-dependent receptor [Neolewinella aurantiaca]TXF88462.1 outer membrane beta-barrel protein [Neolewinella aurantiaca]